MLRQSLGKQKYSKIHQYQNMLISAKWTASLVAERLEEAAITLKRLPSLKIQGYFSTWPQIVREPAEIAEWDVRLLRMQPPPSTAAISRMEEALDWFYWLTEEENRLLWMRANKIKWKAVCTYMGCGRTAAWECWVVALCKIALKLEHPPRTEVCKR